MADDGAYGSLSRARICIDFGTALSKASLCLDPLLPLERGVRPIPLGKVSGAEHPLLTPSVLFVEAGKLYFGPAAFELARQGIDSNRDPILSFKTVLGARDVTAALNERMRPSIDPTGTLKVRDALVLYLAYLDQLLREALSTMPDMPPNILNVRRRYTSPVWKPGSGTDHAFEAIFNEAAAISAKLGKLLTSVEGVSIAQCKDALDKAAAAPGDGKLETGVFEPHAAAAASLAFTTAPVRFILVLDIGAGTTDVAAFEFDETTDPPSLTEVREARQCSALAGDEIDRILVELFFRKRGGDKTREDEIRLLRGTKLAARELKKELFTYGKASLKAGFLATTIKINDLLEDEQFRAYLGALGGVFANALSKVAARAQVVGADVIDVVLAGGGSNLPFLPALVRKAATDRTGTVSLRVGPLSPSSSLYDGIDPSLSSAFPQIAMSVGGALVERMDSSGVAIR